jgi:hypothetical protein
MDFANFREGCRVLSAVALYGAIVSTFNYVQAARKDRRDVFVQATTAIPTYGNTLGNCLAKGRSDQRGSSSGDRIQPRFRATRREAVISHGVRSTRHGRHPYACRPVGR